MKKRRKWRALAAQENVLSGMLMERKHSCGERAAPINSPSIISSINQRQIQLSLFDLMNELKSESWFGEERNEIKRNEISFDWMTNKQPNNKQTNGVELVCDCCLGEFVLFTLQSKIL